jgi:hypothetical protein
LAWLETQGGPAPRLRAAGTRVSDLGERLAPLDRSVTDWEEVQIAPRGLDLARLVFIALLGAGPSRYLARDHRSRADAAVDGYLSTLRNPWQPSRDESRWWMTVAGIQFVHRRWQLAGQPAPWEQAADVLCSALTDDVTWAAG